MFKLVKESFYKENFDYSMDSYKGVDYSKIAVILPGQGSLDLQVIASEMRQIAACGEYIKKADLWCEAVGLAKLSGAQSIQFKNISEEFLYKNLFLFTLNVALYEHVKRSGRDVQYMTSHSFGECASLVCSGLVSFEDGLQIVKWREEASPEPGVLGTLIAISGQLEDVEPCLQIKNVSLANVNSKNQIVLAVSVEALAEVKNLLKKNKMPAVELKAVARPYHSSLMQDAGDKLKNYILQSQIAVYPVANAFLSSVNQQVYSSGDVVTKEQVAQLMADQLTHPVYFDQQIQKLEKLGIHSYLELGFSEIYVGFVGNILNKDEISTQSMRWLSRKTEDRMGNRVWSYDVQNSPLLGVLRKYINKVTGYDVLDIQIHDQFQEDLRIDSIKKAEIVFKTLEELNLSIDESLRLAQLRSVGDIVDFLEGLKAKPIKSKVKHKVEFHIHNPKWNALPKVDSKFVKERPFAALDLFAENFVNTMVNHFTMADVDFCFLKLSRAFANTQEKYEFINQIKQVFTHLNGMNIVIGLGLVAPQTCKADFLELNAFLKSIAKEYKIKYRSCLHSKDLDFRCFLGHIFSNPFVVDYCFQNDEWYAKSFVKSEVSQVAPKAYNKSKSVLVIGGHRGLGFELLKKGIFAKETEIVLVGRTDAQDKKLQNNLQKVLKKYQSVRYYAGDARDVKFLEKVLVDHKVDLVINSAGLEFSRLLIEKSPQEIEMEFGTKAGIWEAVSTLQDKHACKVINFSSVAAEFGNAGQTVYAMASAYQARDKRQLNIFWPPLERVGMTENLGILMKLKESGLGLMPLSQAASLFKKLLAMDAQGDCLFVTSADLFLYDIELSIDMSLFKALGYLIDPKSATFVKMFSGETDRYVMDHVIEKMPVIPASYELAALTIQGSGYFKNIPDLLNFNIKNIMLLVDSNELKGFTHFDFKKDGNLKATVFTQMEHFGAELTSQRANVEESRQVEHFNVELNCKQFYSPECVDFGPKMQVIESAYFNNDNQRIIGFANPENFYLTGSSIMDIWMSSFEVGFQVMALKGIMLGKGLCIPLSLDSIQITRVPKGKIKFQVDLHEIHKDNDLFPMKGTVRAYDELNRLCFKMNNIVMSKIRHFEKIPFDAIKKEFNA